jgi:very-short-patch-repair endonuclease
LQVPIDDPADGWWCRVDMLWPEQHVVLEADGKIKYTGAELWREKRRQLRLERLGYRVVRAIWSDVHRPQALLEHLRAWLRAPLPL